VWDPQAGTVVTQTLGWDMFCNAMAVLPDGRVLINGGNLQYDPFHGQPRNALYDPATGLFADIQNMAHGRWYPTATVLADGSVMTFSGLDETGATNTAVEFYSAASGWSAPSMAGWTPPLYPRLHLLPDGRVLYSGSGTGSRVFTPSTKTWTGIIATTNYSGTRTYGTSVLLPLTPANSYRPRVMIFGGGNPATPTTEIIDMSASTPQWQYGPSMSLPRIEMNATILPNGRVLATGGSKNDEEAASASLKADLYDPISNTFSSAGANAYPRLYHSGSLLLPDATVALLGGNPTRGSYEQRIEVYKPAYLFNADGSPASRPTIGGLNASSLTYGGAFQVSTPDAANIGSVVLVRPGAPTHSFDMEQRLVGLSYSAGSGVLNVTAPPDRNIAPPGYYMLFVLNSAGVPSVATFVQLTAGQTAPNNPPSVAILSPNTNVTINPGQAVSFSGSGSDPDGDTLTYSWSFAGGNPPSSPQANAGNVTYSTPGSYVASFTATDTGGLTSVAATRTVTISDFGLSASPASQTVSPGGGTSYTATVTGGTGFSGNVSFGVNGLPAGATASFNPTSVASSGATTVTVATSASTPSGSYPLTITGTSGPVSHSANVTLTVSANLPPTASIVSPATNATINPGETVSFSGSGSDPEGGAVTYAWAFPGGSPASATQANAGNVTYATPGSYVASLIVRDAGGMASVAATRTITVSDFGLSASPASQTITQGGSAGYTVTVAGGSGFSGVVSFSVTGLPVGATPSFSQPTVTASGSTTLTVTTSASILPGSYPLTIKGTSGPVSHTANVTLIVNVVGDFSISVTPASNTVASGNATTFTVTITPLQGFSSNVTLSTSSLPKFVNASFSPASLSSGTAVLTLSTKKQTKAGSYSLSVTGTAGNLTHTSSTFTLVVQ
jgi:PKD repeat protein